MLNPTAKTLFAILSAFGLSFGAGADSTQIILRNSFMGTPTYSVDGGEFGKVRGPFSMSDFKPEFRDAYGRKYGFDALNRAEDRFLLSNLVGIPAGAVMGFGLGYMLTSKRDSQRDVGKYLALAGAPFFLLSMKFHFDSFAILRDGME